MSSSQVVTYAALIAASLSIGYWTGVGSTLPITRSSASDFGANDQADEANAGVKKEKGGIGVYDDNGNDSDALRAQNDSAVKAAAFEECKMVLVVRSDLNMSSGKIAAQCSHATLACYKALQSSNPALLRRWEHTGQTKVALRCDSEGELHLLEATAHSLNLCAHSIQDAGRTQIAAGSRTVVGIGPGPARLVNQVTGKLRLL